MGLLSLRYMICLLLGCRATVEAANGTVSSPSFGLANYPSNQECLLRIHNPSNTALSLKFDFFSVHGSDSVQVFDGISTSGLRLHPGSGFSGTTVPKITLTASNGTMLIRFTTDALHNSKGWHARYSAGNLSKYFLHCQGRLLKYAATVHTFLGLLFLIKVSV